MSLLAPPFAPEIYQQRRDKLAQWMRQHGGGVMIIPNGQAPLRSEYAEYPFRFDSQFYYLSGFTEQKAWLVLHVTPTDTQSLLFCQDKNEQTEIWEGLLWGPQAAQTAFGFDEAHTIDQLEIWMRQHLAQTPNIWFPIQRCAVENLPQTFKTWLTQSRQAQRHQTAHAPRWMDITPIVSQMRQIKDAHEIATMRRAGQIAAHAHCEAMRRARPGLTERVLQAQLFYTFLTEGAQDVAYDTIVATGANACILHHRAGHDIIGPDDLILIDAGCELDGYASDITRTFPASGHFSSVQADLYDIVLHAQEAAIAVTQPGASFNAAHEAAVEVITQGLVDEKLLRGTVSGLIEQGAYQRFYMHRTGHWLGLDVHDVGAYRQSDSQGKALQTTAQQAPWVNLEPGMVLTIEPGLYIRPDADIPERYWNQGIRIEDDALITQTGCELLTRDVPVTRHAIETLMQEHLDPKKASNE
ncbi:aminopeptidase P N-terminal domain-containing protein [Orrella sp. 11846]|uniref:aminopeptidase P N-terminal domain-containing protein n=1 Tax=Orrella sp. 11846 TaxID=3409913 RepID=UPI003B591BDD